MQTRPRSARAQKRKRILSAFYSDLHVCFATWSKKMAAMQRGAGDEAAEAEKLQELDVNGGPHASKGHAGEGGDEMLCDADAVVSFNCKFPENAMRGAGDAFFEKAPRSPIPSGEKPIFIDDREFAPEELKIGGLPENDYIVGDLGRQGYVFRRAPDAKPTVTSQPAEQKETH